MSKEKVVEAKVSKKNISSEEFEKRVEIEAENLRYFEYMRKEKAFDEARKYVDSKFAVA